MANFLEKWSSKKADKPKAGARNVVDTFRARVAEQKAYLEEYERDAAGFKKWRSTWFQRVPGGYGVTVGRDSVNAGRGLSYVVVDAIKDVAEFLDDLAHHAENDVSFRQALEQNRQRRVSLLTAAKTGGKAATSKAKAKAKPAAAKPVVAKSAAAKPAAAKPAASKAAPKATRAKAAAASATTSAPATAEAAKPKRTRKPKAATAAE